MSHLNMRTQHKHVIVHFVLQECLMMLIKINIILHLLDGITLSRILLEVS